MALLRNRKLCEFFRGALKKYSTGQEAQRVKVLYDGACPLCVKEITVLQKFNKENKVDFVDITKKDFKSIDYMNITYEDAMKEMHVIDTEGEVHTRVSSFRVMYGALGLGWLWSWTRLPTIEPLVEKAYMWFARNRLKWTGRDCDTGQCASKHYKKHDDK